MLIQCRDCGKEISDTAMVCPHCGRATQKPKGWEKPYTIGCAVIAVIISFIVMMLTMAGGR
jgi:predicted amidophosphoribosyltransferase